MKLITEIKEDVVERSARHCRERGVVIPTFAQMKDPTLVPERIRKRLSAVGLWDVDPANLFRITWKNEPVAHGGGYNNGTWVEFPSEMTGVNARIIGIVGMGHRRLPFRLGRSSSSRCFELRSRLQLGPQDQRIDLLPKLRGRLDDGIASRGLGPRDAGLSGA